MPETFPPQQEKTDAVKNALLSLSASKSKQEKIADIISKTADSPVLQQFAAALSKSNRLMTEDLLRESGYMLPQSQNVQDLIQSLLDSSPKDDFPKDVALKLLTILKNNGNNIKDDKEMNESQTQKNLMAAFTGESEANRKYLAYAKKAEKDGHLNAAKLFKTAADAETIHALKHFEVAGKVGATTDNLKDAIAGETHEYSEMYPDFVKQAEADGNKAAVIGCTFAMKAEEVHARLYTEALETLDQTEEVFYYLCPVCGNIEKSVPGKCSICGVPGTKFIKY
jgi:rubrerythrin